MVLTLLKVLGGGVNELQSNKLEATLLETANDVADDATLDTIGLDETERCQSSGLLKLVRLHTLTMM